MIDDSIKEEELKEIMDRLIENMEELREYCEERKGIGVDMARDIETIIREDIVNEKRDKSRKVKNIIRLCYVVDFVYGLIFDKDEFGELLEVVRKIVEMTEEYRVLDY